MRDVQVHREAVRRKVGIAVVTQHSRPWRREVSTVVIHCTGTFNTLSNQKMPTNKSRTMKLKHFFPSTRFAPKKRKVFVAFASNLFEILQNTKQRCCRMEQAELLFFSSLLRFCCLAARMLQKSLVVCATTLMSLRHCRWFRRGKMLNNFPCLAPLDFVPFFLSLNLHSDKGL